MTDLPLCPFCGQFDLRLGQQYEERAEGYGYTIWVIDHNPHFRMECTASMSAGSEEEVILRWSRRAAALAARVAEEPK